MGRPLPPRCRGPGLRAERSSRQREGGGVREGTTVLRRVRRFAADRYLVRRHAGISQVGTDRVAAAAFRSVDPGASGAFAASRAAATIARVEPAPRRPGRSSAFVWIRGRWLLPEL